ncbi:alpha-glucan family phosphorylase [Lewinella sp. LCG006]|uniref:alpha-glucan family phosphorylase n=1 Tax=Lewinella sp. LCG006 TaxID=3231911 RepID=UPI00345FE1C7
MIGQLKDAQFKLKRIFIESQLPAVLEPLRELSNNLWWSWNEDAIELFHSIDSEALKELNYNPVALLDQLSLEQAQALAEDKAFLARLKKVDKKFKDYLNTPKQKGQSQVAYFSMEYGLHISLRLYSGGLGVLAGDYLKEASDDNANLFAVGLLYRYGYFKQALSLNGDQIHNFPPQEFTKLPIAPVRNDNGDWIRITIDLKGRAVQAKLWVLKVGRIDLYLLDTDLEENSWEDRSLTHQLYGGDNEHRLKQEILLGIGGTRAIQAMGLQPDIYHLNEGHASFLSLERLKHLINDNNLSYTQAVEVVRASSLFTTHTPVPAGHDHFPEYMIQQYLHHFTNDLGISWHDFMALGRVNADAAEDFNMSHLAIRLSQEVNGVSKLHGTVSQKMFTKLFPGYTSDELHIGYVTNSVHYPTWIANEWHQIYTKTFGEKFLRDQYNHDHWRKIHKVPDTEIMATRRELKSRLLSYVKDKIKSDLTRRGQSPRAIFQVINNIREDALVLGFARRFATYKRAHLMFSNVDRLRELVNSQNRPVIFLFAGKAHPADGGGQDLIRHIIDISKRDEFVGKVIFLEDYNMEMAKLLVQGVDIWLNTPTRPLEASGTSGMKAAMNGVVNFSVLDGWWAEGYRPDSGWALSLERTYEDQSLQNELDAENIYNILETEIIPTYFDFNEEGISPRWVSYVKNIIAEVAPFFTMQRMLHHYYERFYNKLFSAIDTLRKDDFKPAKELAAWKDYVRQHWSKVHTIEVDTFDASNHPLPIGQKMEAKITVALGSLAAEYVGVELVFFKRINDNELDLVRVAQLELKDKGNGQATYAVAIDPKLAGVYEFGFRIYPHHPLLANRQGLNLVHWV